MTFFSVDLPFVLLSHLSLLTWKTPSDWYLSLSPPPTPTPTPPKPADEVTNAKAPWYLHDLPEYGTPVFHQTS